MFETETGKLLAGRPKPYESGSSVSGLAFSADGKWVLCVRGDGALLCDAATATQRDDDALIRGTIYEFSMSADATRLACRYQVARRGNESITGVGIWNLRTGKLLHRLGGESEAGIPAFAPSGDRVAVTGTGASNADTTI